MQKLGTKNGNSTIFKHLPIENLNEHGAYTIQSNYLSKNFIQMRKFISFAVLLLSMSLNAQVQINEPFAWPDINVIQVGDRAYAFGGTDLEPYNFDVKTFIMPYWRCFSSDDLINWRFESMLDPEIMYFGKTDKCFAGHGVYKNNKWYWYMSNFVKNTGVAVADSPKGPWKDALGKPLLPEDLTYTHEYDGCVFTDDDGQSYMIFGSWHEKKMDNNNVALNDRISLKEEPRKFQVNNVPQGITPPVDAPFLHKHGEYYYLSWRRPYAISKNIYGPYEYVDEQDAHGHLGFFDFNNQNFVNYTTLKEEYRRRYSFCSLAYVHYNNDGSIAKMEDKIAEFGVGQYSANWDAIEAEWFMKKPKGPEKLMLERDKFAVKNLQNNDYLFFPNIHDFPYNGKISITYACGNNRGGEFIIRVSGVNGPIYGKAKFRSTGSWKSYQTLEIPMELNPPGTVSIAICIKGEAETELVRIDKFSVNQQ